MVCNPKIIAITLGITFLKISEYSNGPKSLASHKDNEYKVPPTPAKRIINPMINPNSIEKMSDAFARESFSGKKPACTA